ncbi:MAG: esterase [Lachnospiraceae bacterium]|nr:esterase [Lachnospiraceae bacterium]
MNTVSYADKDSDLILVQMSGAHERESVEKEVSLIKERTDRDFMLLACFVDDWNRDLSPWKAGAVFGNEPFAGGAEATLNALKSDVLGKYPGRRFILGGYSMAGLFALWASYRTDAFCAVAAASPSVWYPDFLTYATDHEIKTNAVYLSLGDKEERTKNKVMRTVGDNIKALHERYTDKGIKNVLEWNEGNHFTEPDVRLSKAFAWTVENI